MHTVTIDLDEPWRSAWESQAYLYDTAIETHKNRIRDGRFYEFVESDLHLSVTSFITELMTAGSRFPPERFVGRLRSKTWDTQFEEEWVGYLFENMGKPSRDPGKFFFQAAVTGRGRAHDFFRVGQFSYRDLFGEPTGETVSLRPAFKNGTGTPRCRIRNGVSSAEIDYPDVMGACFSRYLATGFIVFHEFVSHGHLENGPLVLSDRFKEGWLLACQEAFWVRKRVGEIDLQLPLPLVHLTIENCIHQALGTHEWSHPHEVRQRLRESTERKRLIHESYELAKSIRSDITGDGLRFLTLEIMRSALTKQGFEEDFLESLLRVMHGKGLPKVFFKQISLEADDKLRTDWRLIDEVEAGEPTFAERVYDNIKQKFGG